MTTGPTDSVIRKRYADAEVNLAREPRERLEILDGNPRTWSGILLEKHETVTGLSQSGLITNGRLAELDSHVRSM